MATYTLSEVAKHNSENDCWIVVNGKVYDVTRFLADHPGGKRVLLKVAGTDASAQFASFHAPTVLTDHAGLCIGTLSTHQKEDNPYPATLGEPFGSETPFAEPYWYRPGGVSPYYKEKHAKFRAKIRQWVETAIAPNVDKWEEEGDYPASIHRDAYKAGIFGACWPEQYGGTPPEGGFDGFMDIVFWDELTRSGGGWLPACFLTINIALPPILNWGSEEMKERVGRACITGEKIICLCITEPHVGSDVANLQTTAVRQGDHYIVNGEKKFITSGLKAHYFTVACRTGGPGMKGISLLLLESNMPGITTRKLKTQGWSSSNTAYIVFDNVKVPASNLIGNENEGFLYIMHNFNHERFAGITMGVRGSRVMVEEAIEYAKKRMVFGKRLIDSQVIRHKLAEMIRRVESTQAWLEQLMYEWENGQVNPAKLGGSLALLKVHTTKMTEFCAREASQIIGGNSLLKTGPGRRVERFYRDVRIGAIGGGSEEVMLDLAMNMALGRPKL